MKDILGKELQVGDIIVEVSPFYSFYLAGKITRFSDKSVFFIYETTHNNTFLEKYVNPKYVLKVSVEDLQSMIDNNIDMNEYAVVKMRKFLTII